MTRTDIIVKQDANYDVTITVKSQATSLPIPLTDYTGKGEIREEYGAEEVIAEFTVAFLEPRTDGKVTFSLPYAITAALDFNKTYVYDMTIKSPAPEEKVTRLLEGTLTVSPGVTKWI